MNTIKVNIDKLQRAEYNPRKELDPGDEEYQKLKRSINEFGYVLPIVINNDFTVIGGHQRLTVLKDLGYEEIDCVQIDVDDKDEKMLNIALNNIEGEWNMDKLEDVLRDINDSEYDATLTGFDENYIDEVIGKFDPLADDEEEEESVSAEEPEKIVTCPKCQHMDKEEEFLK